MSLLYKIEYKHRYLEESIAYYNEYLSLMDNVDFYWRVRIVYTREDLR